MNPFSQLAPNGEQIFREGILLHRQGGVLKLTIDRINDLNRLMPEVLLRIESITQNLQQDSQTQVLIITGQGEEFFSMGIMNPVIRASYSKDQVLQLVQLANRTFDAVEALPQIVIAALNGKALAGAVELSNVDIGAQFVDMISFQRAFSANAKTITTADELLVETVNLKR